MDCGSSLMLLPFIKFDRPDNFTLGAWVYMGQNPWYPWFGECRISLGWWDMAFGIRYKKVY